MALLKLFLPTFFTFLQVLTIVNSLGCVDEEGNDVDWYVLYKLPELKDVDNDLVNEGTGYMYITSEMISSGDNTWRMSDISILDDSSAAGRTLSPVYDDSDRDSLVYVFYNDEKPVGDDDWDRGHTKGVFAAEDEEGFWMLHNVPHLAPSPPGPYEYPHTGQLYGQSFLCLSLTGAETLDKVGHQFLYSNPQIYAHQISGDLTADYPNIASVVNNDRVTKAPYWAIDELKTPNGDSWTSYAKSGDYADDIYAGLVSPHLKTPLVVENWRHYSEDHLLPSNCSIDYPVYNVNNVKISAAMSMDSEEAAASLLFSSYKYMPTLTADNRKQETHNAGNNIKKPEHARQRRHALTQDLDFTFKTTDDHSKWCVSTNSRKPWICVGDMNRATTQNTRGGALICIENADLWEAYHKLVDGYDECPNLFDLSVKMLDAVI